MSKNTLVLTDNVTGLNEIEKKILKKSWVVFKKDLIGHGMNILQRMFTAYPEISDYFDFSDYPAVTLTENKSTQAHAINVMSQMGNLIEYGLDDPELFTCLVSKLGRNHYRKRIKSLDLEHFCDAFRTYFLDLIPKKQKGEEEAWVVFYENVKMRMVSFIPRDQHILDVKPWYT